MLKPFNSPQYRKRTESGRSGDECCLCGKDTAGLAGAMHVPVDHTCMEFVTAAQVAERGNDVSYYPVGPECARKWRKEFDAESVRLRMSKGRVVAYDSRSA